MRSKTPPQPRRLTLGEELSQAELPDSIAQVQHQRVITSAEALLDWISFIRPKYLKPNERQLRRFVQEWLASAKELTVLGPQKTP